MTLIDKYHKPTPVFWRKVGDAILLFGTTLTTTFASMEVGKGWVIAASLLTAMGKIVTNFAVEVEETPTPNG